MIRDVTKIFDAEITRIFLQKTEVRNFLLKHERKKRCIENLCAEIVRTEGYRIDVSVQNYRMVIKDFAKMFSKAALEYAHQQNMSKAEKSRQIYDADKIKRAEEIVNEIEKETLHEHRDEDWAQEIIKEKSRASDEVQEGILSTSS